MIKKKYRPLIKGFLQGFNFLSEDTIYKKHFENTIGPQIYRLHINEYFISCIFCSNLGRSHCHEYCFKCMKNEYNDCSTLLPGIFSFCDSYFDAIENEFMPWIFRTPCTNFERLGKSRYFNNFLSNDPSITITNYESLEGIFLGISRGKRPCHICAGVNMDILKECRKSGKANENTPCSRIIQEVSARYRTVFGIVRYEG